MIDKDLEQKSTANCLHYEVNARANGPTIRPDKLLGKKIRIPSSDQMGNPIGPRSIELENDSPDNTPGNESEDGSPDNTPGNEKVAQSTPRFRASEGGSEEKTLALLASFVPETPKKIIAYLGGGSEKPPAVDHTGQHARCSTKIQRYQRGEKCGYGRLPRQSHPWQGAFRAKDQEDAL